MYIYVHVFHHNFIRSEINSYGFTNIVIYEEKKEEEKYFNHLYFQYLTFFSMYLRL